MIYLFTFLSAWLTFHPIHVSVTEITFDEKEKELEIISRIFIDDLESAIRASRNEPGLKLLEPTGVTTDQLVSGYLQQQLKISLDGKAQKIIFLGHEIENEAILCYIQVTGVKRFKNIEVTNGTLVELYDDQSNLVHVTVGEKVKSLRLMRNATSGKLQFDSK